MLIKLSDELDVSLDYLLKGKYLESHDWLEGWFQSLPHNIQDLLKGRESLGWLMYIRKLRNNNNSLETATDLANTILQCYRDVIKKQTGL